jgi:hypothetical protein
MVPAPYSAIPPIAGDVSDVADKIFYSKRQKRKLQASFELQNMRGAQEQQREQMRLDAQAKEKAKSYDQKERFHKDSMSKKTIKAPPPAIAGLLRLGKVPKPTMDKYGWNEKDASDWLSGIADTYGWKPRQVPDDTPQGGMLGFGAKPVEGAMRTVYDPPKGSNISFAKDTTEPDEEDNA